MVQVRERWSPKTRWILAWLATAALVAALLVIYLTSRKVEVTSRETTTTAADSLTGAAGAACETHTSCPDGSLCTRGRCAPITATTTECRRVPIRFTPGATELSSFAEVEVERAARCLMAGRTPALEIDIHADDEEVTHARRATVRRALERRGVTGDRLRATGLADAGR